MGREDNSRSNSNQSNRSLRKPPPSLGVGAHSIGGPGDFARANEGLNTSYYSKQAQQAAALRITNKEGAIPTTCSIPQQSRKEGDIVSKGSTDRTHEDSSISCSDEVARIPLEVDHFDGTPPPAQQEEKPQWIIPVVIMALTAVLAIVIPCAVILTREPEPANLIRATPPPLPVKANMTLQELQFLVPGSTEATLQDILRGDDTPQNMAIDWVKSDDGWDAYPDWRKVQRYAMTTIWFALNGPTWGNFLPIRLDWGSHHLHECEWNLKTTRHGGPLCDDNDRVISLSLRRLGYLNGQFPVEVERLDHLKAIDVSDSGGGQPVDKLFETILEEGSGDISRFLPNLEVYSHMGGQAGGSIPSWLGTLSKLTSLDLSENSFGSTIPSQLGLLTNMETLLLAGNDLTGSIPSEFNSLSMLTSFTAEENLLQESPLPGSFCSKEPMILLTTDWCQGHDQCCSS